MLGDILGRLADDAAAADILTAIARPEILERIERIAEAEGETLGALVASRVRHLIDHGGEEVWLDLLSVMSGSPQPGAAAVERVLSRTFPAPAGLRVEPQS